MKRSILVLTAIIWFVFAGAAFSDDFESIRIINSTNWAGCFNDWLGGYYESHGCLHFSPADIYLLTQTLPPQTALRVESYNDRQVPFDRENIPYFADAVNNPDDLKKYAYFFKNNTTEVVVYPSLEELYIKVNGLPYIKVRMEVGPEEKLLRAYEINPGGSILWDLLLATPTDQGNYKILRSTSHYLSATYYKNTIIPFGAWLVKKNNRWLFEENGQWYKVPSHVIDDLNRRPGEQSYNYYDVHINEKNEIQSARFAGHDFGKYVLLWTLDGKNHYPEMGYALGELVYEQIMLVKDLVHILTAPGPDELDVLVAQNRNFSFYKELYEFVKSRGRIAPREGSRDIYDYYRLFNGFGLGAPVDARVQKAFDEFRENRLPRDKTARYHALGLYYFLRLNSQVINKQAYWYEKLKQDWEFLKELRVKLREDFKSMGIRSLENRQNVLEQWFNERLEFRLVRPPAFAKYVGELSFSSLFRPQEEAAPFTAREQAVMRDIIQRAISGEGEGIELHSVKALNDYNFGLLLDEILGDLYKSHGCLHVSPRNSYFLYELLPKGAEITIYGYDKKFDDQSVKDVPYLTDMINVKEDLEKLKENFTSAKDIKIAVYPSCGIWIIFVKELPFAKLWVKGGPQEKFYLMQGRDKDGMPIFEDHLAYPSTPGTYFVFKKTDHYISNIYYPTTMVPMGGVIAKGMDNKWYYRDKNDKWKRVHAVIEEDLSKPPEQRGYAYYDPVKNASGEVYRVLWGSHPFGKYAIQTSKDKKTPFPELIHTSGDLIMEQRQIINDLIKIMSAPYDRLEDCVANNPNFDLYRACYDFVNDPQKNLIEVKEAASYKLYYDLPLASLEAKSLPRDVIIANKILKNKGGLTKDEIKLLIKEGIAYRRGGEIKINMQKILGLQFDTYQYVVTIQKYANHYSVLKNFWPQLSNLRRALLKDFNEFVIQEPVLMHNFMREMMLKRTELEKLSQKQALEVLYQMIGAGL